MRVTLDGTTVLTDPALRPRIFGLIRHAPPVALDALREVDAVLISHAHHDHLDLPSLAVLGAAMPIIVARGAGVLLARAGFQNVTEVSPGDRMKVRNLDVTAVPARHAGRRMPFGPAGIAVGYTVDGAQRVYFAGDTGLFAEMAEIRDVGLALLPVGGWGPRLRGGHLDPRAAATALTLLRPRRALPIHWGTYWPAGMRGVRPARFSQPGNEFRRYAARLAPGVEILTPAPGERLLLPAR